MPALCSAATTRKEASTGTDAAKVCAPPTPTQASRAWQRR